MRNAFLKIFSVLLLLTCINLPLIAAEPEEAEEVPAGPTSFDLYMERVDKKFDKGAVNFVAGWTEFLSRPAAELKDANKKNAALKFAKGFGEGLFTGIADTLGGFFNSLTALFPDFEIPLPNGGIQSKNITGGEPVGAPHTYTEAELES